MCHESQISADLIDSAAAKQLGKQQMSNTKVRFLAG
jgi:hypothetical protein